MFRYCLACDGGSVKNLWRSYLTCSPHTKYEYVYYLFLLFNAICDLSVVQRKFLGNSYIDLLRGSFDLVPSTESVVFEVLRLGYVAYAPWEKDSSCTLQVLGTHYSKRNAFVLCQLDKSRYHFCITYWCVRSSKLLKMIMMP